jgi:hypothetical protein
MINTLNLTMLLEFVNPEAAQKLQPQAERLIRYLLFPSLFLSCTALSTN